MTLLNPYLHFNGQCQEAMEFYQKCIGGELFLQKLKDSPLADTSPVRIHDQILHSSLTKDGITLMATDMVGTAGHIPGNNVCLSLSCSSEEEMNRFFSALSQDGRIIHEVHRSFWGALFGVFTDKYGIEWMVDYDPKNNG